MKIFLTGATGFLGHHLLPMLSSAGHDCVAVTRYKAGCRELLILPRVTVQQADAFDDDALDEGLSAEEILNKGLMPGMDHVGVEFKAGNMFVPEVLRSARAMQAGMDLGDQGTHILLLLIERDHDR